MMSTQLNKNSYSVHLRFRSKQQLTIASSGPGAVCGAAGVAAFMYQDGGFLLVAVATMLVWLMLCKLIQLSLLLLLVVQMSGLVWVTHARQKQRAFGCGASRKSQQKAAKQ
jgi:hypothetical protein